MEWSVGQERERGEKQNGNESSSTSSSSSFSLLRLHLKREWLFSSILAHHHHLKYIPTKSLENWGNENPANQNVLWSSEMSALLSVKYLVEWWFLRNFRHSLFFLSSYRVQQNNKVLSYLSNTIKHIKKSIPVEELCPNLLPEVHFRYQVKDSKKLSNLSNQI